MTKLKELAAKLSLEHGKVRRTEVRFEKAKDAFVLKNKEMVAIVTKETNVLIKLMDREFERDSDLHVTGWRIDEDSSEGNIMLMLDLVVGIGGAGDDANIIELFTRAEKKKHIRRKIYQMNKKYGVKFWIRRGKVKH
jgi:hypothetical protein